MAKPKLRRQPIGRINKFMQKLMDVVPDECGRFDIEIPSFARMLATGERIQTTSLPAWYVVWQALARPDSYQAERLEKGRLEFFYIAAMTPHRPESAREYLHDLREVVRHGLIRQRQRLGLLRVSPLLSIPSIGPQREGYIVLRDEYDVLLG